MYAPATVRGVLALEPQSTGFEGGAVLVSLKDECDASANVNA
jgi:hypothetical protein